MNDRTAPTRRSTIWVFPLTSKLVLSFALLCAILAAIGGVFFFSLRSIEKLNTAERSSASGEIATLQQVGENVGLRQVEVFRHVTTANPVDKERHEQVMVRLGETNTKALTEYAETVNNESERRLLSALLQARKIYADRTEQLLALSRAQRNAEAANFILALQVPTYDRYQSSVDAMLRFEEAEGRAIAATTTGRIEQTRTLGNTLIGFAIIIALGTGAAVARMVRRLKKDKEELRTEVADHECAEQSLREGEARYRLLVDHSPDAILVVCDEKIVFVNPATLDLLGAGSSLQLIGRSVSEIIHPDEHAEVSRRSSEVAAGKFPPAAERRLVRLDGSVVDVESRVISFLFEDKPAVQVIARAITERKRAERAQIEGVGRLRFLNDLGDATRSLLQPKEIMGVAARLLGTHLKVSRCAYAEVETDGNHFTIPDDYTHGCASIVGKYRLADFGRHAHSELAAGRTLVLHDVDAELASAGGADAFNGIESKAIIVCPLIKNGELRAMMAVHQVTPRPWTNPEIALVQEVVQQCWSIMERARAELVVRESEEHLRLVIAASNDGIFEHDYVTDVLIWSDRMFEMFGLDRQSFVPTIDAFTALLHPDDRAAFQEAVRAQMAHGGRYDAHTRIRRRDGSYGHFLGRGRVVLSAAGKPIRIVGSMADLTSLLQAEQKLVEQGNLLNLAQDAIMVRNMDDRFEFWNHGAEALYGWKAEEVRGHPNDDFLQYDEAVKILAERTLLETGAWSGECRHLTKRGEAVIVRSRWTLVRDEHGQPKSKLVIATDMTEQKKAEEQFLRAQRLESIGTLASGVAHDLNNILVPIMMVAPVLRGEMDPVEREKFLDIVETSAHRGADIIKQVLTFARGTDGDRILLQPIYLLEEVSKIASQTFPKSITLRTSYEENIRSLEADSTQLHQVLLNLCINARDAMPDGGQLCLSAENFDVDERLASITPGATAGPHVMLRVTDTGSGIPKQVLAKIFDPFFTTKNVGRGTGLGLSTVAGIVKSHGGFIQVESSPGNTSFRIFLPAKATVGVSGDLPPDMMIPRGHGETVLLVDDEPSIREVAEFILNSHGYNALVAEDGPAALAIFAQEMGRIALVVTDLAMPGMGGLLLARTLRRIKPQLKVIVSTGGGEESDGAEIAALGLDGYLTKPYTRSSLLLKISHVLQSNLQDAA